MPFIAGRQLNTADDWGTITAFVDHNMADLSPYIVFVYVVNLPRNFDA